ncbi:hypothetical protein LI291_10525 [Intestinibacillus massiliensis]|nr:hypothetical protein [Intestinibacillus massiliensis]
MNLSKEALQRIEKILDRGNTVEIKRSKDGVKIFEVCRTIKDTVVTSG